ncbi:MAG: hypothetical protein GY862_06330 [Gammaproteobacteria bacterium]|nr:hypothetical protein [Gammaproteobacteria bacterium]
MKKIALFAAGLILSFNAVQAAEKTDCAVHYTRTACAGQEAVSYKKCGGEQSCVKHKPADSLEACQAAALKSCKNKRLDITKSKVITAKYKGEAIKTKSGKDDFCLDYENKDAEFNHCPEDSK